MKHNFRKLLRPLLFGLALGVAATAAQALPNRCNTRTVAVCQSLGFSYSICCQFVGG